MTTPPPDAPVPPPDAPVPPPDAPVPPPGAPVPPSPAPMPPTEYTAAYRFAPVVREPWINPAKRRNAGLLGAGAALVLLAAGFVIGLAVGDHGDQGDRGGDMGRHMRMRPGYGYGDGFGYGPGDGRGPGLGPMQRPDFPGLSSGATSQPNSPTSVPASPAKSAHS